MPKLRLLAVILVGLSTLAACGPTTPKFKFDTAERRGRLANGLRFVVMPDPTTKLVEVDVRYDVGSREDPPGKAGLAHLVEHMMFQIRPDGPTNPPLFKALLGMTTEMNANTAWDRTHYFEQSRVEVFTALLKIEAMRMWATDPNAAAKIGFGCSAIPEAEFEREREVVRNEIRAQSSADGQFLPLLLQAIYPAGHPYARETGGNDDQIAHLTLKDACDFMAKYYTPDRAIVLVAGGVTMDDAIKGLEHYFSPIPKRVAAPRVPVPPLAALQHVTKTVNLDVERSMVTISWALPPRNTPEGEAARFATSRVESRLARAAHDYDFAYSVGATERIGGEFAPTFTIIIELKSIDKLDEALEFAKKAASQAYRGFADATSEQVDEIRAQLKAQYVEGMESLTGRTYQLAEDVQYDTSFDFDSKMLYQFHELDKITNLDFNKVGAVIKDVLDWDKALVFVVKANKEGIKGDTRSKVTFQTQSDQKLNDPDVDPNKAFQPQLFAPGTLTFADLQQVTLGNGMNVMLLPIKSMPIVTADLVFRNAGTVADPTSPMIGKAAADFLHLPRDAEAEMSTGTYVDCNAGLDSMSCSVHNIDIYLDVMLKALERQIHVGSYESEEIESWQKELRESFQTHSQQEETEYARQVYSALFGPDHPYTLSALETPEAAAKVHLDDLNAFRKAHYTAGNATLIVVGNFDPGQALKLAKDTFGGWDRGRPDKPVDRTPAKRTGPIYIGVVASKENQQVTVEIAYPSPGGIDGEEGARDVLATMLDERAEDVRFKLGSTYGLYFGRSPHVGPTAYRLAGGAEVGGTIDAERAGESIKALRESIDGLRAGDHFNEDFVTARRDRINHLLGQSTVTREIAGELSAMAVFGLSPNFLDQQLRAIGSTPPALVKALIKRELDPSNEVIVILGDRAHLEKTFTDAGITDVKYVEPEYRK